jgi:hypothetical protein
MMRNRVVHVLKIAMFVVAGSVVVGFVVKELWNALVPQIFGGPLITYWQALGLFVLSKLLFGGFHRHGGGRNHWKQQMMERWAQMSDDEREKFRSGVRGRRGWCRPPAEPQV